MVIIRPDSTLGLPLSTPRLSLPPNHHPQLSEAHAHALKEVKSASEKTLLSVRSSLEATHQEQVARHSEEKEALLASHSTFKN